MSAICPSVPTQAWQLLRGLTSLTKLQVSNSIVVCTAIAASYLIRFLKLLKILYRMVFASGVQDVLLLMGRRDPRTRKGKARSFQDHFLQPI